MKVVIEVKQTERVVAEIGDMPVNLLRDLLMANKGTFDGNWSPGDLGGQQDWIVDSVTVEPETKVGKTK